MQRPLSRAALALCAASITLAAAAPAVAFDRNVFHSLPHHHDANGFGPQIDDDLVAARPVTPPPPANSTPTSGARQPSLSVQQRFAQLLAFLDWKLRID